MIQPTISVLPDLPALAQAAAESIATAAEEAIAATGRFTIALSGGNTPKALYRLLAGEPWASAMDWPKWHVFFSDERCVPPDHADSNFRSACEALLDQVPIPYEQMHRMKGELEPQAAAEDYERILERHVPAGSLDLVLLGMGTDGHTASLFPHAPALDEWERRCLATYVASLAAWRLTLTANYINLAGRVLVLVSGANKAAPVTEALEGPDDPHRLPIQLISPLSRRLHWLLDAPAAGMV